VEENVSVAPGLRHLLRALVLASTLATACALAAAATAKPPEDRGHARPNAPGQGTQNGPSSQVEDEGETEATGKPARPERIEREKAPKSQAELLAESAKVDDALASVAAGMSADARLRVLVFGQVAPTAGALVRRELAERVSSLSVSLEGLGDLVEQSGVDFVALDVPVRPASGTPDLVGGSFTLLDGADFAWDRGATGRGVGVAVVDSGIAPSSAFGPRLRRAPLGGTADAHGHGTFVAGVLGARTTAYRGVAPGVRLYDVNVAQPDGVFSSDVVAGLEWVLANHRRLNIRVVNLSLAETLPSSYRTNPMNRAVAQLWRSGVVVVAAAGNLGPGSAVYAPANDPYAITVGALDQSGTLRRADDVAAGFSATGPTLDGFAKPDLLAPGRRIVSLLPADSVLGREAPAANVFSDGLASMSGTSFAAPQVAGAAAILLQRHPSWTPDEVKWVLTRTSRAVAGSQAGTVDVRAALSYRGAPGQANRILRQTSLLGGLGADGADFSGTTWTSNTWTSNTWTSNTWTSNTWTSNTWTSARDWFTR
jgi:serine protease AprX